MGYHTHKNSFFLYDKKNGRRWEYFKTSEKYFCQYSEYFKSCDKWISPTNTSDEICKEDYYEALAINTEEQRETM
ncbi:hypothetical protein K413DRAFT_4704 [Clostridium sp. ASBs410]|nr:hypothetical protein K413DRAFT_4704 [Clostridium sp. ASBs410]